MPHGASASTSRNWEPTPAAAQAEGPPSKRDLTSWWRQFKRGNAKREEDKGTFLNTLRRKLFKASEAEKPRGIFGVPLQESIKYANVAISLLNEEGQSYIYGYVPIVVAKCGVFLKEKAVDIEGIFRLSGSEKRIKELREAFNSPDRYGKGLDWTGYTVHDAANILRRYFNTLPEPIIPLEFYESFRRPLRNHQAQAVGQIEGQGPSEGEFDIDAAIKRYQKLITELPPLNRQLLLYILDLLAVFASKSDFNKMTTPNLAAIFQPGILSHPSHDMAPPEYRLSQDVLIFLIENQDNFLIGMQGTAADAKTVEEVESGPSTPVGRAPTTPSRAKTTIGRSSSNASAGAESVRRQGLIRRNVSVSSKRSRASGNVAPSPVTPSFTPSSGSGVHRSNTVPSKKSPAVAARRFDRENHSPNAGHRSPPPVASVSVAEPKPILNIPPVLLPGGLRPPPAAAQIISPPSSEDTTPLAAPPSVTSATGLLPNRAPSELASQKRSERAEHDTPTGFRSLSNMFSPSPSSDGETKEKRRPNKLQKKRAPSTNPSAASSSTSLHNSGAGSHAGPPSPLPPGIAASPPAKDQKGISPIEETLGEKHEHHHPLQPSMSPTASMRSHSTVADYSEMEHDFEPGSEHHERDRRRRWRISHKKEASEPPSVGTNAVAEQSMSSFGSKAGRKSLTLDPAEASSAAAAWAEASKEADKRSAGGPIEWFRGKLAERKEREEAKARTKSPPNSRIETATASERQRSASNLSPISQTMHGRGRSVDLARAEPQPVLDAREQTELKSGREKEQGAEQIAPSQSSEQASPPARATVVEPMAGSIAPTAPTVSAAPAMPAAQALSPRAAPTEWAARPIRTDLPIPSEPVSRAQGSMSPARGPVSPSVSAIASPTYPGGPGSETPKEGKSPDTQPPTSPQQSGQPVRSMLDI